MHQLVIEGQVRIHGVALFLSCFEHRCGIGFGVVCNVSPALGISADGREGTRVACIDTVLAVAAFRLLGADVAWSASVTTLLREPGLVRVGPGASVGALVCPRVVRPETTQ